jgi:hypothetical protein
MKRRDKIEKQDVNTQGEIMRLVAALMLLQTMVLTPAFSRADSQGQLKARISWGYQSPTRISYYIKLAGDGVEISDVIGYLLESEDGFKDGAWESRAGGEDVDGVEFTALYRKGPPKMSQNLHVIWADLIANSDFDTARRLRLDPVYRLDSRKLTVQTDAEGMTGFSVTVDQLLENRVFWVPSLDIYLAVGDRPVSFADYQKDLAAWKGKRVLEQIHREPEATYEQYLARWEDMGNPGYVHPAQPDPGHIVCLSWDSAIHKFGIDRGAGIWNDLGNPDRFRFWFGFGDLSQGITELWKSQRLADGLPVITTVLEKDGVGYEVEQFAHPLHGAPRERRGDIGMVLLQKVKLTELLGRAQTIRVTMSHRRKLPPDLSSEVVGDKRGDAFLFQDSGRRNILFAVENIEGDVEWSGVRDYQREMKRIDAAISLNLPANGSREFVVKLPSPMVDREDQEMLLALDYSAARKATLDFWTDYISRGAQFRVPEKVVNDLFQANLWHALRLPRRHGGQQDDVKMDLPYSNFAYHQTGTPWPINQSVYVDYMLYDLRGYHDISAEELGLIYHNNQEANGCLSGVANWVVYTPGMLYAVAKNYMLSQDREALDTLMPPSLKALDWCLDKMEEAACRVGPAQGLIGGPLNDGTGEGVWAFNQAYVFAGLDLFGRVLQQIGHPRAEECLNAARAIQRSIQRGFHAAAMHSPLVQLRDHTWTPYVPCEAATFGRIFEQWYPTDVDTGAVHLLRLKALPAQGDLADALLNDHEDNLYLKGWGVANEPVYNPQGTAYLLRDDPQAVIRVFYSYMASAFSHSVLEPVEHRWTHGQYFGPPSTDGAWFELYRNMLIHELDDDTLLLSQATPRAWLDDGKRIDIERAPTYYGRISLTIESHADSGSILAEIEMPDRSSPKALLVRLRHPQASPMQSATVNGENWPDFDVQKEWVRIKNPCQKHYSVVARY